MGDAPQPDPACDAKPQVQRQEDSPTKPGGEATKIDASAPALSAEEQMERFAQELKENDWGHQPN